MAFNLPHAENMISDIHGQRQTVLRFGLDPKEIGANRLLVRETIRNEA